MTDTTSSTPRATLLSCMRNEGLFVVEWLAHHLALGFDQIIVFTNNCTDGTDKLLSRLQDLGYVRHIDHMPEPGKSPQINAMNIAMADPAVKSSEWVLHIDADEFVHVDDGNINNLLDKVGTNADIIVLLRKLFGDAGLETWPGGSVLQQLTMCQGVPLRRVVHHKSLFRPQKFNRCTDHMPKQPLVESFRVATTTGETISGASVLHHRKSRYKAKFRQLTYANACLNHYSIKSRDIFLMKNDRGDGHGVTHSRYYLNSQLHRTYNRNEVEDRSILAFWPRIEEKMAEIRQDPEVRALEEQAFANFSARRDLILTEAQIAAWTTDTNAAAEPDEGDED